MGANAQTSVPLFTAGEVLTAANQNISAGTGVPVFATTVTRDAAFGGSGEKVLAEGQLAYIEASNVVQYYDGASWETVGPSTAGGLTLISTTTIGSAVSSVTVSSAFSSTYDNYKIIVSGGAGSTNGNLNFTLGATSSNYYFGGAYSGLSWSNTINGDASGGATSFWGLGTFSANSLSTSIELFCPNLAKVTSFATTLVRTTTGGFFGIYGGFLNDTTQYTAFTITTSTGTLTGGTIKVYGYQNS